MSPKPRSWGGWWFRVFLVVLAAAGIVAYRHTEGPGVTPFATSIQILTRDDAIPREVIDDFQNRFGIKVKIQYFDSNDELLKDIETPGSHWDLAMPSSFMATYMMRHGLLSALNHRHLPNLDNAIAPAFKVADDPNYDFQVPYQWGSIGIAYNQNEVDGLPKSWSDAVRNLNPDKPGDKLGLVEDMRYVLGCVLIYLGHSPNTNKPEEIKAAFDVLSSVAGNIGCIDSDLVVPLLVSGKISMAITWAPDTTLAMKQNRQIRLSLPKEGSIIFRRCLVVPKSAANYAGAEKFANFLLEPEVAGKITNGTYIATTVKGATEFVDRFIVNGPSYFKHPAGKNFFVNNVPPETEALEARLWKQFSAPFRTTAEDKPHGLDEE